LAKITDRYLPTLDGWRAIAILAVLFAHNKTNWGSYPILAKFHVNEIHENGYLGVWVFFSLSGLLICSRLLNDEAVRGAISLSSFYIRRIFRIQPAAIVALVVILTVTYFNGIHIHWPLWLPALLLYKNYNDYFAVVANAAGWYTGHFWSLSLEEHFYLILPFLLVVLPRYRVRIFAILIVLLFVWNRIESPHVIAAQMSPLYRTDLQFNALLIPATIAILLRRPRFDALARYLNPWALLVLTAVMLHVGLRHEELSSSYFNAVVVMPIFGTLLVVSTIKHPQTLLGRFLELKPMRFIGHLSYSIYLYQQLFFSEWPVPTGWLHVLQDFPGRCIATFAAALLSYYFVEKPMIRVGHRLANRISRKQPASV